MLIGRVVGTAVSTVKDDRIHGLKLLIVQPMLLEGKLSKELLVAASELNAGEGDLVLVVTGVSASAAINNKAPIDASVLGILDHAEIGGKKIAF